jgi:hypothetical protein
MVAGQDRAAFTRIGRCDGPGRSFGGSVWGDGEVGGFDRLMGGTGRFDAHARSGDRIAIAVYLGGGDSFDRALLELSIAYAEQNDRDYRDLAAAVKSGKVTAQTGL